MFWGEVVHLASNVAKFANERFDKAYKNQQAIWDREEREQKVIPLPHQAQMN